MLQGIDIGNLAIALAIGVIAIAILMGCYGMMNLALNAWEMLTGNHLEDKCKNCMPWHNRKES